MTGVYTFIINLGYVEESKNSSLIFTMPSIDIDPMEAVATLIRILLFDLCDGDKGGVWRFLRNFNKATADSSGDTHPNFHMLEGTVPLDLWGVVQTGTVIYLNAFDLLFSDDPYDQRKFTMEVHEGVVVPDGLHHTAINSDKPLYDIDQMILDQTGELPVPEPKSVTCPHCMGTGQVPEERG